MTANGAREKLLSSYDRAEAAYIEWINANTELKAAQTREQKLGEVYLEKKRHWDETIKACSPGLHMPVASSVPPPIITEPQTIQSAIRNVC